jgi:hypothetical protein
MATLDEIIVREVNPFDPVSFITGNFWTQERSSFSSVDSIHQEVINEVTKILDLVAKDSKTRTILLDGERGSGKSYLLGRLKKQLNSKAVFAYIETCPNNDHIWRHTLRYTVDSLMYKPEGEKKSQLLLWLISLSVFKNKGLLKQLLGEKRQFIHNFQTTYPVGIYQARQFFGVLYELTQPDKYTIACDWLRGEYLDEEDLRTLGVNFVIDNEEAARGILGNFGRIADATKPIVLCFDQVELAPKLADGTHDISTVFNVNTALHNNMLRNFLVVISIVTDYWKAYKTTLPSSDLSRIQKFLNLKQITLEQVEALWKSRLYLLYSQITFKAKSSIAPLDKQELEKKYPGGKANLRDSLNLGGRLFQEYKSKLLNSPKKDNEAERILPLVSSPEPIGTFKLIWQDEFNNNKRIIDKIRQFSEQELIDMLQKSMQALQIKQIKPKLFSGHYASYSFSHLLPDRSLKKQGIIWHEEANMRAFGFAMKACEKALQENQCDRLILIKAEKLGNTKTQAYKLYQKIFQISSQNHIAPSLEDVHYLRTYQLLANKALSGDLVINYEVTNIETLKKLVCESKVLEQCKLLQKLEIISIKPEPNLKPSNSKVKEYLLNLIQTQHILGKLTLIDNVTAKIPDVNHPQVEQIINDLCQQNSITILNPDSKPEEQIVCWVPQKKLAS